MACRLVFHVVSVAVDRAAFHFDKLYSYTVPAALTGEVRVGAQLSEIYTGELSSLAYKAIPDSTVVLKNIQAIMSRIESSGIE